MAKVLIVDDDHTTVSLLRTLLELDGFDVRSAANSKVALEAANTFHPDAFLIDFHLSDCDGTDFIRQLRSESRFEHTPMIMASGSERKIEARDAGADAFLTKPFDPSLLVDTLNNLLEAGNASQDEVENEASVPEEKNDEAPEPPVDDAPPTGKDAAGGDSKKRRRNWRFFKR